LIYPGVENITVHAHPQISISLTKKDKKGIPAEIIVGRRLAAAENKRQKQKKRQEMPPRPYNKRSTNILFVLLFTRLVRTAMKSAHARASELHICKANISL
jgi:hypothetical protein